MQIISEERRPSKSRGNAGFQELPDLDETNIMQYIVIIVPFY